MLQNELPYCFIVLLREGFSSALVALWYAIRFNLMNEYTHSLLNCSMMVEWDGSFLKHPLEAVVRWKIIIGTWYLEKTRLWQIASQNEAESRKTYQFEKHMNYYLPFLKRQQAPNERTFWTQYCIVLHCDSAIAFDYNFIACCISLACLAKIYILMQANDSSSHTYAISSEYDKSCSRSNGNISE